MVDIVITWVDGNDPVWQNEKNKYEGGVNVDRREARYRDWGILKYTLRSIEKFAPWADKVFLITYGHYPEWISHVNPRLKLIKHTDYIPNSNEEERDQEV